MQEHINALIGMTKSQALAYTTEHELSVRIAREDGDDYMLTLDINPNRLNLIIEWGEVSAVKLG